MNRLYGTTRDFRKVPPGNERISQIRVPVQRTRRGFAIFAMPLSQCATEFGGFGSSIGKGVPYSLEILSNLRFLILDHRRRILQELCIIEIASLAAANPEMVGKNCVKPGRRCLDFGDGPGNVEGGVVHTIFSRRLFGSYCRPDPQAKVSTAAFVSSFREACPHLEIG
jgi:hypothetical protein